MIKKIELLKGKESNLSYEIDDKDYKINWKSARFKVKIEDMERIKKDYFKDENVWYPLGANLSNPIKNGLGEYLSNNFKGLSTKHASAIAAILYDEKFLNYKKVGNAIFLIKINTKCMSESFTVEGDTHERHY